MKVAIVTAVYNRAETIGQALDSVAAQSHDDIEHFEVDGASVVGTLEEIRARMRPEMRVIHEP